MDAESKCPVMHGSMTEQSTPTHWWPKNLNLDIDFMEGKQPTAENIACEFWKILAPKVADYGALMHKIQLAETNNNIIEYFGE